MKNNNGNRLPAFQFYPTEFMADENVMVMGFEHIGVYLWLMCICWWEGSIPNDIDRLARLCRGMEEGRMVSLWPELEPCFEKDPENPERLVHPRLVKEREKQLRYKKRMSDIGKRGAKATWGNKIDGQAKATPRQDEQGKAIPDQGELSVSSSISDSKDIKNLPTKLDQSESYKEWCAFLENHKTHNKSPWNKKRYKKIWYEFIEKYDVSVMIGLLFDRDFYNADYAVKALKMLDDHEFTLEIQSKARERYWEIKKAEWTTVEGEGVAFDLKEAFGDPDKFNPREELKKIIKRTGKPRGEEAVAFAAKWGL